jgi:hypothetical protein
MACPVDRAAPFTQVAPSQDADRRSPDRSETAIPFVKADAAADFPPMMMRVFPDDDAHHPRR